MITRKPAQIALAIIALAAFALALFQPRFGVVGIVVAGFCLILLATSLSNAGRIAVSLQFLQNQVVDVSVWGAPLPDSSPLEVASVTALSAGLLIYLRDSGATKTLLKVAQPGDAHIEDGRVTVDRAAYVSWGGAKSRRVDGVPAVVIAIKPGALRPARAARR